MVVWEFSYDTMRASGIFAKAARPLETHHVLGSTATLVLAGLSPSLAG